MTVTGTQWLTSFYDADLTGFGYHRVDLTDGESIAGLAAELGPVDIVVNNAAPRMAADLDASEREFVAHASRIGLVGPFQLASRLRLQMAKSQHPAAARSSTCPRSSAGSTSPTAPSPPRSRSSG